MNETEARTELEHMIFPADEPTLGSAEVSSILRYARRPDESGRVYGDTGWTPTWDLYAAATEGWTRKAGKAANRFSFLTDGQRFDRAAVYRHCIEQARLYGDRAMGSIPVATSANP